MRNVPTTCPFCACGCGFFLLATDAGLAGVTPGESHPVAKGRICCRGWGAHEAPVWGRRLLHPTIRRNGNPQTVSWNIALSHVAEQLQGLMHAGRPVGVLGSARATNEENYLAGRLARAGLHTNHIDFSYHTLCRPFLAGFEDVIGECFHSVQLADVESADAILLVEGDLAKTHARAAASVLKALEKGAHLIVVGCARTQMARVASCFLEAAPGSEREVIHGLAAATIRARTGTPLADADPTSEMRTAAAWIGADRTVFLMGPSGHGAARVRAEAAALASLAAATGQPGRPGHGLLPLLARNNARGACEMGVAPNRLPGYQPIDNRETLRCMQSLWGKSASLDRGWDAEEMLESLSGLIVVADDPAAVLPSGQRARAALERIPFLVVLDAFDTPAVRAAHAVLPVASFAETEGTYTNMEGRVQKIRAATPPPGEAREGWKVLAELCTLFDAGGGWSSASEVFQEIVQAAPRYAAVAPEASEGWGSSVLEEPTWADIAPQAAAVASSPPSESPYVLALEGSFDWSGDPLVAFSPTLNRDGQSVRKLWPGGFVEMSAEDADALGARAGWRVKLSSVNGEVVIPIQQRKGLRRGALLVPYAFRDCVSGVLGEAGIAAVKVERV